MAPAAGAPPAEVSSETPSSHTPGAGAAPIPAVTPAASATDGSSEGPRDDKRPRIRRLTDAQLVEARQVAADFAAAYGTYSYREEPEDAAARMAPFASPELAAQLSDNAGGSVGRQILADRRQEAVATVETVSSQRVAADGVDLLVVVAQKITSEGGTETRWPAYRLRVARSDAGWRVTALQP